MTKKDINQKYVEAAARADSGDIPKVVLEKGDNIVRIIDLDFEENYVIYLEDTEGNTRKVNMGIDIKENKKEYAILFDSVAGLKPGHRYYFKAIQGKKVKTAKGVRTIIDPEVRLLEVGPTIFKQISAIQTDPEFPDVTDIDLKINKKGEKLKTEYTVLPSPKASKLPELEGEMDLSVFVEKTDLKTCYEIVGENFEDDESEEPVKKSKKKSAKVEEVEEDDTSDIPDETEDVDEVEEDEVEEDEAEEDEVEEDEAEYDDEFAGMDRLELRKYIKSNKLEIAVLKKWSDDDIRDEIRKSVNTAEDVVDDEEDDDLDSLDDLDD